jgi:hypothetical protein
VREGKHGARSPQQAIAFGLDKPIRAGVPLKPPARGKTNDSTRKYAERAFEKGQLTKSVNLRGPVYSDPLISFIGKPPNYIHDISMPRGVTLIFGGL